MTVMLCYVITDVNHKMFVRAGQAYTEWAKKVSVFILAITLSTAN